MAKARVGNVGGAACNWWSLKTPELGTFSGRTFNEVIKKFDSALQSKYPGETVDAFYVKHRIVCMFSWTKTQSNRFKEDRQISWRSLR